MKVLHINSYFSTTVLYKNFYDEQLDQDLDISVYVPVAQNNICADIKYGDYTKVSQNHGKFDRFFFHRKHKKILADIVKQYSIKDYDLLHSHSLFSNGYISYRLSKEFDIPYIVAVRDTDLNIFFKKMIHLRKLGVEILKNASGIIFLSSTYKEKTINKYVPNMLKSEVAEKSYVVPNGINDFWLKNRPKEAKKVTNELKILYVGRISKRKNILKTIEACEILIKKGYNTSFTVVGPIDDENEHQKIISYSFVNYFKPQSKEELIKFYRSSDVFIMPSKTETFGLVYAESISQGVPIIYSKGQGFDGQFEDGFVGYRVDYFNAKEIADRVVNIINNYEEISKNCIDSSNKFDWRKIVKQYTDVYSLSISD